MENGDFIDHRRLNPMSTIEDKLDALSGAQYFGSLDLLLVYWQVEFQPPDRDKHRSQFH